MIVDDSLPVRKYVRELLVEHRDLILVGEAENISEGLQLVIETKPNVLILDINLPGGSGLILLSSVKALKPECKIIMMSNQADSNIRREAKSLGADHFLDKAFEFEQLIDAIRT